MSHGDDWPHSLPATYRVARTDDLDVLVEFNRAMARETEGKELDAGVVRAGVRNALADPARGFYVVALAGDAIEGSLMITFEWSDWRNGVFWWLQSVYVRPGARGRGIFRGLYRFVRDRARAEDGVCGFRLYVEKDNRAAQSVYESLGMRASPYLMYETTE